MMYPYVNPLLFVTVYVLINPHVFSYTVQDYSKEGINQQDGFGLRQAKQINRLMYLLARQQDNPDLNVWAETSRPYELSREDGYDTKGTTSPDRVMKIKRDGPPLSIVNALDVLRQQMMLNTARRKMKENQNRIRENNEYLKNLGKRSISYKKLSSRSLAANSRLHRSNSLTDSKVLQTADV